MRHAKSGRKFNRTSSHRQAMFRNMASSLFLHEQITTTLPKAKELRGVVEPLITLAKQPSVANRRIAFARLRDRDAVTRLFDTLAPRFKDRPGGYLRVLKAGFRAGDTAPIAVVQLLDRPETSDGAAAGEAPAAAEAPKKPKKKAAPKAKAAKPVAEGETVAAKSKAKAKAKSAAKKTAGKKTSAGKKAKPSDK